MPSSASDTKLWFPMTLIKFLMTGLLLCLAPLTCAWPGNCHYCSNTPRASAAEQGEACKGVNEGHSGSPRAASLACFSENSLSHQTTQTAGRTL